MGVVTRRSVGLYIKRHEFKNIMSWFLNKNLGFILSKYSIEKYLKSNFLCLASNEVTQKKLGIRKVELPTFCLIMYLANARIFQETSHQVRSSVHCYETSSNDRDSNCFHAGKVNAIILSTKLEHSFSPHPHRDLKKGHLEHTMPWNMLKIHFRFFV